tara:strand:- start:21 stop:956 length:936 start_codon:yes stop_codon:yes gene_type:complete
VSLILLVVILTACSGEVSDEPGVRDLTRSYALPPDGGFQLVTPDLEVQPFSEVFWCYYGTWSEPDVGVDFAQPLFSAYNHHAFVQTASIEDPPDGTTIECTDSAGMIDTQPLFELTGSSVTDDGNYLPLPPDTAIRLSEGQRWVIESHFVNPTPDILLVNTAFNFGTTPVEEVEHWASSFEFDLGPPLIPNGGLHTEVFDCVFPNAVSIISLSGHMHGHGHSFTVDLVGGEGDTRIYEVEEWYEEYRDYPPMETWDLGEVELSSSDSLRITCTWDNNSGLELAFPDEMCTAKGLAAPLDSPATCTSGDESP